jgi:dephospho-CoA kinase
MASSTTKRRIEDTESDRDRRKQRKWSKAEETAIADYIKENYNRYKVSSRY